MINPDLYCTINGATVPVALLVNALHSRISELELQNAILIAQNVHLSAVVTSMASVEPSEGFGASESPLRPSDVPVDAPPVAEQADSTSSGSP